MIGGFAQGQDLDEIVSEKFGIPLASGEPDKCTMDRIYIEALSSPYKFKGKVVEVRSNKLQEVIVVETTGKSHLPKGTKLTVTYPNGTCLFKAKKGQRVHLFLDFAKKTHQNYSNQYYAVIPSNQTFYKAVDRLIRKSVNKEKFHSKMSLAKRYIKKQQFDKALRHLDSFVYFDFEDAQRLILMAIVHYNKSRYQAAYDLLETALRIDEDDAAYKLYLIVAEKLGKKPQLATEDYEEYYE